MIWGIDTIQTAFSLSHENGFFQFYVFYREPRVKVYRVVLQVGAQKKVGPETKLAS